MSKIFLWSLDTACGYNKKCSLILEFFSLLRRLKWLFLQRNIFLAAMCYKTGFECSNFYSACCVGEGFGRMVANDQIYEKDNWFYI